MQRNLIIALTALVLLLALALGYVLLRGQSGGQGSGPASMSMNAADENVVDPMRQEMDCIDRLMQNNDLTANQVGPALASCRGGTSGNQSNGQ